MIYLDLETRSEVDLTEVGPWIYSTHPSTEVLCMAHKTDDRRTQLWTPDEPVPSWAGTEPMIAHNAWFESSVWINCLVSKYGFPVAANDLWHCSSAWCCQFAIPRSLEWAAVELGIDVQKDKEGHDLMLKMCKPTDEWLTDKTAPKWHESLADVMRLGEYCVQDVDVLYGLVQKLRGMSERIGDAGFGGF